MKYFFVKRENFCKKFFNTFFNPVILRLSDPLNPESLSQSPEIFFDLNILWTKLLVTETFTNFLTLIFKENIFLLEVSTYVRVINFRGFANSSFRNKKVAIIDNHKNWYPIFRKTFFTCIFSIGFLMHYISEKELILCIFSHHF